MSSPRINPFTWLALGFALLCVPLMLSSHIGSYAADETDFHLPAIRQIRAHWPRLDLERDSLSAISPGYHYALATVSLITGVHRLPLRLITWCLSLSTLALLWRSFPREWSLFATMAVLPLACSNFFVKSASWIVTDNPGLLAVCAVLALSFGRNQNDAPVWRGGLAAAVATFIRQLHVWTAFPVAWNAARKMATASGAKRIGILLPALFPLGVLAVLVLAWKGLVPPAWQTISYAQSASRTAPLCYLGAVFFLFGIFYHAALPTENLRDDLRRWPIWMSAIAGLVFALLGPTNYDMSSGRWGGYLWEAVRHLPAPGDRSWLFIVLTPLGTALFALLVTRLRRQAGGEIAGLWAGSFLAWTLTCVPNRLVFQRYYEPMTLVFLIFWLVLMLRSTPTPTMRPAALRALALAQLIITLGTAHYQTFLRAVPAG